MGNKTLGYVLSCAGIIVLASSFSNIKTFLSKYITVLSTINNIFLYIIGGVLILAGIYFLMGTTGSKQPAEVPIYQGKNIVGYRRG